MLGLDRYIEKFYGKVDMCAAEHIDDDYLISHRNVITRCDSNKTTNICLSCYSDTEIVILASGIANCQFSINADIEKNCSLMYKVICDRCQNVDISIESRLLFPMAAVNVLTFFHGDDTDSLSISISNSHFGKNTTSSVTSTSALDGHSMFKFNGDITIDACAEMSNARQKNRNLLFSDDAQATTTPCLNIFNDNVTCSHGATVGGISDDEKFFMMSRGIDDESCKNIIVDGMLLDIFGTKPS